MRLQRLSLPRRRRLLFAVVTLLALAAAGSAYALATRTSGPTDVPGPGVTNADLKAQLIARLNDLGQPQLAPAATATLSTIHSTADALDWSLTTYENAAGQLCVMQAIPGDGRDYTCNDRSIIFRNGPISVAWGSRQNPGGNLNQWDTAWISGFTEAPVAKVELISADCSVTPLPLNDDGAFFTVVGEQAMHNGPWPSLVRGIDSNGTLVSQTHVQLEESNGKGAMIHSPQQAPASCQG